MAASSLAYHTADVFTDRAFGGNPLAIVIDDHGLAPALMQRIAAEFNYSETIFLAPPEAAGITARARIFTPGHEIPFAGHPNIGAAFTVARLGALFGRAVGESIAFAEEAGLVEIDILRDQDGVTGARLTAPQAFATGGTVAPQIIAACARLDETEIEPDAIVASVGLPFICAELASDEALVRAAPDRPAFARHMPAEGSISLALFHRDGQALHVRMFSPLAGIDEDPATGSANAALAALLASRDPEPDGLFAFTVAQGAEMGRPSQLQAEVEKRAGKIVKVKIGGSCVAMMSGQIFL